MLISGCVLLYRDDYIFGDRRKLGFCSLVVMFVFRMLFMLLMPNIFMIMLGWDGLGMVSFCLVIYYNNECSLRSGLVTVLSNRIGDIGILLRIVYMTVFGRWGFSFYSLGGNVFYFFGFMMLLGALTKRAQMPFMA